MILPGVQLCPAQTEAEASRKFSFPLEIFARITTLFLLGASKDLATQSSKVEHSNHHKQYMATESC